MEISERDKNLYHYCSMPKMANIIRSKQLWMSDISKSNDYEEMQLLIPDIYYEVEKLYYNTPFSFEYNGVKGIKAIQAILKGVDSQMYRDFSKGGVTSYVSCFCEDGDDLNLWRGYADDGKGCAIGISLDALQNFCRKLDGIIKIVKVRYCSNETINKLITQNAKTLYKTIKELKNNAEKYIKEKKPELLELFMYIQLHDKVENILCESLKYKKECFRSEKEWRLYIQKPTKVADLLFQESEEGMLMRIFNKTLDFMYKKLEIKETEDDLITYFPIELSEDYINTIICGPKNKMNQMDFNLFMSKYGYSNVKMNRSNISYR